MLAEQRGGSGSAAEGQECSSRKVFLWAQTGLTAPSCSSAGHQMLTELVDDVVVVVLTLRFKWESEGDGQN